MKMMIKVVLSFCILGLCVVTKANYQVQNLQHLLRSRRSNNPPVPDTWAIEDDTEDSSPVYIGPQDELARLDKIVALPGQPEGVDFDQYSGYVTIDPSPTQGKALFYYFVESPQNSSTNPLVLWLNGGPGYSSFIGAFEELGPFRVNDDGQTLSRNKYGWNNFANVIFLESPAGVGFSYSNSSSYFNTTGDKSTAQDAYTFLVNWLERFPQYKSRDFYITGETYAGHYVPQLAYTIVRNNKKSNQTIINLKGIAIGSAWIDEVANLKGLFDYWWTIGLNSDETHEGVLKYCNFINDYFTGTCSSFIEKAWFELGNIDISSIYSPICLDPHASNGSTGSVSSFDPCWEHHLTSYLNTPELQAAFHAKPMPWKVLSPFNWSDSPITILPTIEYLIANGQRVWIYSGDVDAYVPITSSRYSINAMKLPVETAFRAWYLNKEVGGYVTEYKGAVLISVRGGEHTVPSYQLERGLTMFSYFLKGILPPSE